MPIRIAAGTLGRCALNVLTDSPHSVDLSAVRLAHLSPDIMSEIGIPGAPAQKREQARIAAQIVDLYLPPDAAKPDIFRVEAKVMHLLSLLIRGFGSLEAVADRTVLDLGCGSQVPGDGLYKNPPLSVHPWMCRLIHHLGGRAIGVDIRPQSGEPFEWRQVDIDSPHALRFLPRASIDGYHNSDFYPPSMRPQDPTVSGEWDARGARIGKEVARVLKSDAIILSAEQLGAAECVAFLR